MPYRGEGSYDLDVQGQGYISGSLEVENDIKAKTLEGVLIGTDAEVTVNTEATATPVAINVDGETLYVLAYPKTE